MENNRYGTGTEFYSMENSQYWTRTRFETTSPNAALKTTSRLAPAEDLIGTVPLDPHTDRFPAHKVVYPLICISLYSFSYEKYAYQISFFLS